jgi:hypothetical protein
MKKRATRATHATHATQWEPPLENLSSLRGFAPWLTGTPDALPARQRAEMKL